MADPPSAREAWSPVPWSDFPARFRGAPEEWPQPQLRSAATVFWWRVAVVVASGLLAGYLMPSQFWGSDLTGLQMAVLCYALPLATFHGTVFVVAIARPHFPRSSRVDEVIRKTRAARRETLRAIRRGEPIPPEREPLARLWITYQRAETAQLAQTGLLFSVLLVVSAGRPSWMTIVLLAVVTGWLGAVLETLRRERAVRPWVTAHGSVEGPA